MSNISVSLTKVSQTDNSATYKCVITTEGYYGTDVSVTPLGAWNNGKLKNYIGWPPANQWSSSWGQPDWRLSSGQWINSKFGGAYGTLIPRKMEWTDTVSLDRGNSRYKTATVTCGVKSVNDANGKFPETLKTITLTTNEIPKQTFSDRTIPTSIDPPSTSGTRYIRLTLSFPNPDSYYTAKLYLNDGNGKLTELQSETSGFTYNYEITKDMFQKKYSFIAKLWGKDSFCYDTISSDNNYIEPSGIGVTVKDDGNHDVDLMNFKNIKNKEIKEVWVKVNGKIYQTRK